MKLTRTIIDKNLKIIGFFCKGKPSEFGEFGTEEMERAITLPDMALRGFNNKQIAVGPNGQIRELMGFKVNQLPIAVYNPQENYFECVDNTINLVKRVLVNGELKGFDVSCLGGSIKRYTYEAVVSLASWLKPGNFIIRRGENNKAFIVGKPGVLKIGDLPEEEIGNQVSTGKRKRTSSSTTQNALGKNLNPNGSLLELYDIIRKCDGLVIKLPDESYKSNTVAKEKVASEFKSLGVGEIGSAYLNFGDKKLNANTTFKNAGTVTININNVPNQIYTFTWSTKSLFVNGQNHIKRFGIGVTPEVADEIINTFGKSLIVKKINDKQTTEPIISLTGKKDFVFFEVDTSSLEIMSMEKAKECLISNKELYANVKKMIEFKANIKIMKEYIKDLEKYPVSKTGVNKPLFGIFSGLKDEMLEKITEAGVDVYTGAYIKREKADNSIEKIKSAEKAEEQSIEVEYDIAGYSLTKFNKGVVEGILNGEVEAPGYCTSALIGIVKKMLGYKTPKSKMELCEAFKELSEKELAKIRMTLWMHKVAMYKLGNGKLMLVDKDSWKLKPSRSKKSDIYTCDTSETPGLCMKINNVTLK